jgi:hypothetical protein
MFFLLVGHAAKDSNNEEMLNDNEPMEVDNTTFMAGASACVTFDCPENRCIMQFRREDKLNVHR